MSPVIYKTIEKGVFNEGSPRSFNGISENAQRLSKVVLRLPNSKTDTFDMMHSS